MPNMRARIVCEIRRTFTRELIAHPAMIALLKDGAHTTARFDESQVPSLRAAEDSLFYDVIFCII